MMKWLGMLVGAVVVGVAALLIGARFADGPLAILAGGAFRSGELYAGPEPDWSFARDVATVEFQSLEPARSRTTWILEVDGRPFIPCGYMTSWWGRIWKQWPIEAERDPRILLRIDGKLYERSLVRVTQGPILERVVAELARKYAPGVTMAAVESGSLWIFELAPRS
jgi:hypothetical protein